MGQIQGLERGFYAHVHSSPFDIDAMKVAAAV